MMERRNKQNKESLYIIRVRKGASVLPLPSVLLIKVFFAIFLFHCSKTLKTFIIESNSVDFLWNEF